MICEVRSPMGLLLRLTGAIEDIEPTTEGDAAMLANRALIHNAWAYAKNEKLFRKFKTPEKKESHRRTADAHATTAEKIAGLIDGLGHTTRSGWCSACYTLSDHNKVETGLTSVPAYLCVTCGSPTLKCAAPHCKHMATRGHGSLRVPRFCAEHRHELPSFEKSSDKIARLEDYEELRVFDSHNLRRGSQFAMAGVVAAGVVGTGGILAAPAIGGAIGTIVGGYSGAAATSYGLALLDGGSIAAGGLGMVGGTYVVVAGGAALGGALGASITNAYVSEDKSFAIEKFRDGPGIPVIVARGFTTENDPYWSSAMQMVERRYPDSPIYRLHWGSKELKKLGAFALKEMGARGGMHVVVDAAAQAGKIAAKKLNVVAPALMATNLAKNPWHTAVVRADRTGVALAGILARTKEDSVILVGHSLGARAMITAAETLGTSEDAPRIDAVHLLGAAEGKKGDWRPLSEAVHGTVNNYFSSNDTVLKYLYKVAQVGSVAVGLGGFGSKYSNIKDRDVSAKVGGHSDYFDNVKLV
ncbi:DUF726 domain-containing protein [Rhodococcus sp. D2-41]|nr:DUF726 domain-containing protein [Rhodococcus sp. D2-41]